MSKEFTENAVYNKSTPEGRFPRIILFIFVAEFCERISYSGMRVFFTLYLRNKLDYTDDEATEIYHIFNGLVYLCPVFGGIVADSFLGKYRTILYMMFVYLFGNSLVALTAIPQLMLPGRLCTLIGVFMITIGTGGIKPCVTAFGGDQFILPQQEGLLSLYFSVLYFNLCVGSLIAKTLSPIFRSHVHCFGDKDCYSLAFGAPVIVIVLSIVVFISGRHNYVIKKPDGNIVVDFVQCVFLGLKNKVTKGGNRNKNSNWLDGAQQKYGRRFINDVKKTLSVLKLFAVLPVFWALLDQMGSRWALQASRMDGRLGFYTIRPDQILILSPITVLSFIALSHKYIYPSLAKCNLLKNPLHKMILGGVMAGLAFVASGCVETYLKTTYPELPQPYYTQLRIFNGNKYTISVISENKNISVEIPPLSYFSNKHIAVMDNTNITLTFDCDCFESKTKEVLLEGNKAVSLYVAENEIVTYEDNVEKSKSGFPMVRFLLTNETGGAGVTLYNTQMDNEEVSITYGGATQRFEVYSSTYSLFIGGKSILDNLKFDNGGVYTITITKDSDRYIANWTIVTDPNSISMFLLVPQFVIISLAEVFFAVSGNEFAFKESPDSMKAVITAIWLLTEAFGNVLIIFFTRCFIDLSQEIQFFLYAGMMFSSMLVFYCMCRNYQFYGSAVEEETAAIKEHDKELELHEYRFGALELNSDAGDMKGPNKTTDQGCLKKNIQNFFVILFYFNRT